MQAHRLWHKSLVALGAFLISLVMTGFLERSNAHATLIGDQIGGFITCYLCGGNGFDPAGPLIGSGEQVVVSDGAIEFSMAIAWPSPASPTVLAWVDFGQEQFSLDLNIPSALINAIFAALGLPPEPIDEFFLWGFYDLNWVDAPGGIIGVDILPGGDFDLSLGGIEYTADSIFISHATLLDPSADFRFHQDFLIRANHVPEPGTWLSLTTGLVGLCSYGWWRRRRTAGF